MVINMFKLNNNYITKKEALENLLLRIETEIRNNTPADVDILEYLDENGTTEDNIIRISEGAAELIYYDEAAEALKRLDWEEIEDKIKNCSVSLFDAICWQINEEVAAILWKYEDRIEEAIDLLACPSNVLIDEEDEDPADRVSIITGAADCFALGCYILADLDHFVECLDDEEKTEMFNIINRDFSKIIEEAEKIEDCADLMGFAGTFSLALEDYYNSYKTKEK